MSTHEVAIVEIGKMGAHPGADRLEVTHLWGWQCVVGKGQFKPGDKAVYIPPDYIVETARPEFTFLATDGTTTKRIKVRKFRGLISQGLLIPVPEALAGEPVGANVIDALGIKRYEPPEPITTGGNFVNGPSNIYAPKFDVESYQRYKHLLTEGENVVITEKIHGANARYVWAKDSDTGEFRQFCGSRTNWMGDDAKNVWWRAFRSCPAIGEWCQANPEKVLYGEVFGQVQELKYGAGKNDVFFAAFAVLDGANWLSRAAYLESLESHDVPQAPLRYAGPFMEADAYMWAEQDSLWPGAKHMSEGVVIVPTIERMCDEIGRVCLKIVSNRYMES